MNIEDYKNSAYFMQFPDAARPIGFMLTNINAQVSKVAEEALEVANAYQGESDSRVIEETFDLIHACETLLRMYSRRGCPLNDSYVSVIEKNEIRGYYGW